jgi:hypothetical protein
MANYSLRLQGFHFLWRNFPVDFDSRVLRHSVSAITDSDSVYTIYATLAGLHIYGLGYSLFARRYFGNRFYFLFLEILRCFSSLGSPTYPMDSDMYTMALSMVGFPIRVPPDLSLFTAPRGVSPLTAPFFGSWCQGIRRMPLLT